MEHQEDVSKTNDNEIKDLRFILSCDDRFRYMFLNRLQSDCEYYLGNGGRNAEHSLWAHNESDQIKIMKALWNSFKEDEKPERLTMEQIEEYEKQMM